MQQVCALSIDVVESTITGNKLSPLKRYEYQKSIIDLVTKYAKSLYFVDYIAKFTGDGWLIFSSVNEDIDRLVVLGKIVCFKYPEYVNHIASNLHGIKPAVRACIGSGQDYAVSIPQQDGSFNKDWLGDSARIASSFGSCAAPGELLIDQIVSSKIKLLFDLRMIDRATLPDERKPKHDEDGYTLWAVDGFKHEQVDPGPEAAPYISYLEWTGQEAQSIELTNDALAAIPQLRAESVMELVSGAQARENQRQAQVSGYQKLLRAAPDAATAEVTIQALIDLNSTPDVYFFSEMIARAPDYAKAVQWYEAMQQAGAIPDAVTYSTLINIAPDYAAAVQWYEAMRQAGAIPDEITTTTLASKAADFTAAKLLTEKLNADGGFRGPGYYAAVMARVAPDDDPLEVIDWYFAQEHHPASAVEPALRMYASHARHAAAMEFVVRWPQLPASARYMRRHQVDFEREITRFIEDVATRPSALYAAAIFNFEHAQFGLAKDLLNRALCFATHESRKAHIDRLMKQIELKLQ